MLCVIEVSFVVRYDVQELCNMADIADDIKEAEQAFTRYGRVVSYTERLVHGGPEINERERQQAVENGDANLYANLYQGTTADNSRVVQQHVR